MGVCNLCGFLYNMNRFGWKSVDELYADVCTDSWGGGGLLSAAGADALAGMA